MERNQKLFEPVLGNYESKRIYKSQNFWWVAILAGIIPLAAVCIGNLKTIGVSKKIINLFVLLAILLYAAEACVITYETITAIRERKTKEQIVDIRERLKKSNEIANEKRNDIKSYRKIIVRLFNVLYLLLYRILEKRQIVYYNAVKNGFYKSMAAVVFVGIIIQVGIGLAIGAVVAELVWGS
jgi:hypothetical protein